MAARSVVFSPEATANLRGIYDLIAEASLPSRALAYVEGIQDACLALATFPVRGTRHDTIRPGLRPFGHRRRVTIAFHVTEDAVVIDRILYAGRSLTA